MPSQPEKLWRVARAFSKVFTPTDGEPVQRDFIVGELVAAAEVYPMLEELVQGGHLIFTVSSVSPQLETE